MGYTIRHLFLSLELDHILAYLEPFTGSINTLTFIWLGTVSLFFIRFYPIYVKVSEDKRKIEEINADVINLNKELEDLVAERTMAILGLSVADKVRNPVAIIGCVSKRLLSKESLSEKVEGNLQDILEECKKLESIVGDFEGILKNRQRLFRYIDINEIVNDIVLLMRDDVGKKGIQLKVNLSPAKINAQKNLIRAALFHLFKNAIEATPPGGSIEISTKTMQDSVIIELSDTGSGIPEELLGKVFEPFFSTRENRIGMGLPLVRQIVAEHLGEIKVRSEVGKGTTFEMIFPVKWCVIAEDIRRGVSNGIKG
jgi:signal transduction histidine kinase